MLIETRAYARAGLLGNPSDGFFGKTLSITVRNFGASVSLWQSPELHIEQQEADANTFRSIFHLCDTVGQIGYNGGIPLIKAAIRKFTLYCGEQGIRLPNRNFTIRYSSSIPRQVGLSGSSAIIVATMRALMQFYEVDIPLEYLPTLVLQAETEELGITAGLQDRVIQCYEGCVYMDFAKELVQSRGYGEYERINPTQLPKLYLAYNTDMSKVSGKVHNDVRARFDRGEPLVYETLQSIANLATLGKEAIERRDYETLHELVNQNFDFRTRIYNIHPVNIQMIETARKLGASASFTGSGGSIIGLYRDDEMLNRLFVELRKLNARVIKPYVM
ncbi:GHMP kinase [Siphonobacter sp. BAB-5405]|uniref:mevalonate kinase family protein n=1 Tax=Siphonobacter sp. BAB-5405 TaxID=1864825 RepID=UPI000C807F18|nr:GHMP kinase [Siphonobacter sp. BAB-5405]PMD97128.1 GHMP kinase [Siphonobacter sp. BAB-5405]